MSDVKWIKIVTDIFDDEKLYAIECMPDGRDIELIWFKILCLAGKCNRNGFLVINDRLAYTEEMLSKIFRIDIGIVQRSLEIFQNLDMIEVVDNAFMVSNWLKYQSGDRLDALREKNKERQQRYRDKQKAISEKPKRNVTRNVTNNVTPSYSYSNNSNISNYLYLLENLNEDYIEYMKNEQELRDSVKTWLQYKDERKPKTSNHYEETGLKSLLKKIHKMCVQYGTESVIQLIEDSIGNNYAGIIWDKLGSVQKNLSQPKKNGFGKGMITARKSSLELAKEIYGIDQ